VSVSVKEAVSLLSVAPKRKSGGKKAPRCASILDAATCEGRGVGGTEAGGQQRQDQASPGRGGSLQAGAGLPGPRRAPPRLREQVVSAGAVAVERVGGVAQLAVVVHQEHRQRVDVVAVAEEAGLRHLIPARCERGGGGGGGGGRGDAGDGRGVKAAAVEVEAGEAREASSVLAQH
jgi:hypothetical protein